MKKVIISAVGTLSIFASVGFYSCSKKENIVENQPKKTILMSASDDYEGFYDLLLKLGFSDAVTVNFAQEPLLNQANDLGIDLSPYIESDAIKLTFLDDSEGVETGYVMVGKDSNDEYDKFISIKQELVTGDIQYVKGTFNRDANGTIVSVNTETHNIDGQSGNDVVTLGEKDLGPRRKGESFNDCFSRNWSNFATDIPSALAQASMPVVIAAAISIECAPKEKANAVAK